MTIEERIELTAKLDSAYADSLRGPRTRGSTTKLPITDFSDGLFHVAADQRLAADGCIIMEAECVGIGGMYDAGPLAYVRRHMDVASRIGAHGLELYTPNCPWAAQATDWVNMIVAGEKHPEGLLPGALVTWYPGPVLARMDPKWKPEDGLDKLDPLTGVKYR